MNTQAAKQINSEDAPDYTKMANALRFLSIDAVEKANSGHPGMPMGMADVATILFSRFLKFDPQNPTWADRDRFVLSAGHGSMLLYSLLYLTKYQKITLDELKGFRQIGSLTPGHPEVMQDAGIETTTGPLGQGISTAVGMALSERIMNSRFGDDLVDHYTYVIASDGDLMEGISHEACAFAGHLKLNRLVVLYDDNGISIDGPTSLSYSDDVPMRFQSYGWDTQVIDGHDHDAITEAILKARESDKPSIICCKTHIGYGSPTKQDSSSSHGSPLGTDEVAATREALNWPHEPFQIPVDVEELWATVGQKSQFLYSEWQERLDQNRYKDDFLSILDGDVDELIHPTIVELKEQFVNNKPNDATRKTSGKCLEKIVQKLPFLIGGSADLTGSNNTKVEGPKPIEAGDYSGQYIYYGVREHGMAAIMNGMALHGGTIPYSGTFLCFSDYCRPSIRLAALMKQRVVHVMTHDSIGLGEDGPTHQPVEHMAALRCIPNLNVFRPCDGVETAESWQMALHTKETPSVLALTRQGLPTYRDDANEENKTSRGAYILKEASNDKPRVILMASGSEVEIVMTAAADLENDDIPTRVVSVPCMDLFYDQDESYKRSVLGEKDAPIIRIAVEAAVRQGWDQMIGDNGHFIGMSSFGESAPYKELYKHFKITKETVIDTVKQDLT